MRKLAGVIVRKGDRLLLVKQARGAVRHGGLWGPPGGGVEEGETFEGAAMREAKEETGLEVRLGRKIWKGWVAGASGKKVECVLFEAEPMRGIWGTEGDESVDEARWVSRKEIEGGKLPLRAKELKEILLGVLDEKDSGVEGIESGVEI